MKGKRETIVVKLGGEILRSYKLLEPAMQEIIAIKKRNPKANVIIVHGAGPQLDQHFRAAGVTVEKVGGKRVSTAEGVQVAWKFIPLESRVLARRLSQAGLKPESIDESLTTLAKITDRKLGFVGEPIGVNVANLKRILRNGKIPIVAIFGVTKQGRTVNVNADQVAAGIAVAMKADLLLLKTKPAGIMHKGKTIGVISPGKARELIEKRVAKGGMKVKLEAAHMAVEGGVGKVRISGLGANRKGTTVRRPGRSLGRRKRPKIRRRQAK